VAYRADIEIAVKGAQELKRLQDQVSATSKLVDGLNTDLQNIGSGGVVRSIQNLRDVVSDAATAFNQAALGTQEATLAAQNYARATDNLNAGLAERVALLKDVNEQLRQQKLAEGSTRSGGPAIRETRGTVELGPGPASPVGALVGQTSPVEEKLRRTIAAKDDQRALDQALLELEKKSAAILNEKLESQQALVKGTREVLNLVDQQNKRQQFLAGESGKLMQGPLAGPGAMGFPVALSLTAAEQKGLATEAKKQEILKRMAATREQLVGLARNLQRLDENAVVAIADAVREQRNLNSARQQELDIAEQVAAIRSREAANSAAARQRLAAQNAVTKPGDREFPSSPIGGGLGMPGSPAAQAAKNQRLESIALGVGFPLLFGGGAGSVGGSLAGSFVGSGFGGQILGGAIGQAIDEFNLKTQELGKALNPLTGDFDKVIAAAGLTGTATANYIKELESEQGAKVALAAATKELAKVIGDSGVEALRRYGDAATDLANAWEVAITQIRAASADLLAGLLEGVTTTLTRANAFRQAGVTTNDPQLESLKKQFDAADRGRLFGGDQGEALRIRELIIDRQIQINQETEKNVGIVDRVTAASKNQIALLENKLKISRTNGDILNTEVFELEKLSIQQEYRVQLAELLAKKEYEVADVYALQLQRNISLNDLNRKRAEAAKNAQESATRTAKQAADKEAGVLKSVASIRKDTISTILDGVNAQFQLDTLYKGEYAVLQDRIKNAQKELDTKTLILDLEEEAALAGATDAREQAVIVKLFDQKAKLLALQATTQNKINIDKAVELKYAKDLLAVQRQGVLKQAASGATLDITQARGTLSKSKGGTGFEEAQAALNIEQSIQLDELAQKLTEINLLKDAAAKATGDEATKLQGQVAQEVGLYTIQNERLNTLFALQQEQLKVNQVTEQYGAIAGAIGTAFATSFKGIIDGSMTAKEALASFFQSVADAFLDMAAQIIAKWITMTILNTVLSLFPGGSKGGSGGDLAKVNMTDVNKYAFAPPIPLATGGFVTGPTNAIIGEGGQPEYVIPASKMQSAMSRYSRGARGEGVIAGSGNGGEGDVAATAAGPMVVDVRYSVERINDVEYVTTSQFQAGMRQAAQQGASQGERRALRQLQQNTSLRGRVGLR
jgi:hypothetical protein